MTATYSGCAYELMGVVVEDNGGDTLTVIWNPNNGPMTITPRENIRTVPIPSLRRVELGLDRRLKTIPQIGLPGQEPSGYFDGFIYDDV